MADSPPVEAGVKRDPDLATEGRVVKRKKVTWADAELELPLASPAGGAAAATEDAAQSSGEAQPAVVVLPCDGLFDALTEDLLQDQVDTPPAGGEALTRRGLLERRLARADLLAAAYEGELWQLLEELRLRHRQFLEQPGLSVWKREPEVQHGDDSRAAAAAAAAGAAAADGGSEGEKEEGEEEEGAAAGGAAGVAAGGGLRALWEQQQAERRAAAAAAGGAEGKAGPAAAAEPGVAAHQQEAASRGQQQEPAAAAGTTQQEQREEQQAPPPPPPRFEDMEALLLSGAAAGLPPVDEAALVSRRRDFVSRLSLLGRLEQSALGATCRQLDALGGLALLCGRRRRYVLRRAAVAIGRCTESQGKVDVDLSEEAGEGGCAQRVSRRQAQLFLEPDGGFRLRCTGRRAMLVNGRPLARGQTAALPSLSHIKAGDVSLLFVANTAAAARAVHSSANVMV